MLEPREKTNSPGEEIDTGFDSGWRAEYDLNRRWGIGVDMFGQIEDLANAGSLNDQVHLFARCPRTLTAAQPSAL